MAIVVIGAVFVDVKGFPEDLYLPTGRNAGEIKFVHGGVGRNVAEDIANVELRPVFVSLVDESAQGEEVVRQLRRHKVNTDYIRAVPNGMGMWLAVFDQSGDLAGSISQRPDLSRICDILDEKGDEIFKDADSAAHGLLCMQPGRGGHPLCGGLCQHHPGRAVRRPPRPA